MRVFALSILAVALFLGNTGSAGAQKDKDKPHEYPTEYGGKSADAWIKAIAQPNRSESVKALEVVLLFGPKVALKAVPVILSELKKHDPAKKKKIDASFVSRAPAALVQIITTQEKPDPDQVKDIVKALKANLKDPQITIRFRTLMALTQLGTFMNDAIEEIIPLVHDPETWEIRQLAATALGRYRFDHKDPKEPSDKLINALLGEGIHDLSTSVRLAALQSAARLDLGNLPKTKKTFLESIDKLLFPKFGTGEKDPTVRITAYSVSHNVTKTKARRDAIANYLNNKESAVRLQALTALGEIGKDAKDQWAKIRACLDAKQDLPTRVKALEVLAHLGSLDGKDGAKIAEVLADYTDDKDIHVRVTALLALGSVGEGAKTKINLITKYIADGKEDVHVRAAGIQALGTLGKIAKGQAGLVAAYVSDNKADNKPLRIAAISSLAQIEPYASKPLLDCLKDKDLEVVYASVIVLGHMGREGQDALPLLRGVANDMTHPEVLRNHAQHAIDHIIEQSKTKKKGPAGK